MKRNVETIFNVVLGTAGHIDHGKSTLVKRLTGVDPDRLPEEKDRGLTIDLGFAPFELRGGRRMGIVDVPGHERLIKNMVAGATGIDLVLLVVAADDGVMPQTREHLTIMEILGIRHGIVAITKADLADEEVRDLVREDIREALQGTLLEDAPLVEVSSVTGEGIEELVDVLHQVLERIRPRQAAGVFRMPIQRVFSPKGFGTVVTGIPVSGKCELGDILEVAPLGRSGRVRGIQAYKEATDMARAGHSAALNLTDIDYRQVVRGMVVTAPGYFEPATMFEARLRYLPQVRRPLLHRAPIRLHSGTAEVLGRVYLLEKRSLEPGEEGSVQFRLDGPLVAAPGDRYVLRRHSPMETIGGGLILGRSSQRLKAGRRRVLSRLEAKQAALGDPRRFLAHLAAAEIRGTASEKELAVRAGLLVDQVRRIVQELLEEGVLLPTARPGTYVAREQVTSAMAALREAAREYYRRHPLRLGMDLTRVRELLGGQELFAAEVLSRLEDAGEIWSEGGQIRWRDFGPQLGPEDEEARAAIESACLERRFTPPSPEDLARDRGWDPARTQALFDLLVEEGRLQKVADGIYFHRQALEEGRAALREHIAARGPATASDLKNVLGSTRKYLIPLLEQFDREGLTVRRGDLRVLKEKG